MEVALTPFQHQVGGSTTLHLLDETTLCKPIVAREMLFYKTLPLELEKFTPKYKGTIDVSLTQDEAGLISYIGHPNDIQINKLPRHATPHIIRRHHVPQASPDHGSSPDVSVKENMDYWNKRCYRKQCTQMKQSAKDGALSKFILLENVTHEFRRPCIIDLKMGTRQYGDDATPDKRHMLLNRCMNSTSATLGVRACGMQVYNAATDEYVIYNKYCCRDVTQASFREFLCNYLHNGHHVRIDVIDDIVSELRSLYRVIQTQDSFRFYSSSLLIIYDGFENMGPFINQDQYPVSDNATSIDSPAIALCPGGSSLLHRAHKLSTSSKVVLRMIDFAHSTHGQIPNVTHKHMGPDRGYLCGLETLMRLFKEIQALK